MTEIEKVRELWAAHDVARKVLAELDDRLYVGDESLGSVERFGLEMQKAAAERGGMVAYRVAYDAQLAVEVSSRRWQGIP